MMKKYTKMTSLALISALLTFANASENTTKDEKELNTSSKSVRITGGEIVSQDNDSWRYVVAVKDNQGTQFCGGSLIA